MRLWTVTAPTARDSQAATAGIVATATPAGPAILLGEDGRGRRLACVPLGSRTPPTLAPAPSADRRDQVAGIVLRAGFVRAGRTVRAVAETPEDGGDVRAAIAIRVPAGYRGDTGWQRYELGSACPYRGHDDLFGDFARRDVSGVDSGPCHYRHCGEPLAGEGLTQHHPDTGTVDWVASLPADTPGVTLIAEGRCAAGQAGRMGGHLEWLLIVRPETRFRIIRFGRLYGRPNNVEVRVSGDGDVDARTSEAWAQRDSLSATEAERL